MSTPELSFAEELQRKLALAQSRRLSPFEPRALAWLVLPPGWTVELAVACRFPAGQELPAFLKQAQAAGMVKLKSVEGRTDFWVPSAEKPGLMDWLKQRFDVAELSKIISEIGNAMQPYLTADEVDAPQSAANQVRAAVRSFTRSTAIDVNVPENIDRWGRLAEKITIPQEAADWLDDQVVNLLEKKQSGEVVSWLDIARPLADLLGGPLETAVRLGSRRLELVYRRLQDTRQLEDFQERPEQLQPFYHLLENQEGVWALHYFGMGGVGKTMLLRFISAGCPNASVAPPLPYISCRVDFDYLNADFPYKKPGQLLLDLAAELRLHGVSISSLRKFTADAEALHSMLPGQTQRVYDLAALVEADPKIGDPFRRMLQRFYDLVIEVAYTEKNPIVVLVLDTCEELAKVPSPEGRLVAVEATYFLLESLDALHKKSYGSRPLPFRVIFSGRRLLAQSGYEWRLKEGQAGGKRLMLAPEKKYLALHELRGFDHRDLKEFYCQKKQIPDISSQAYKAILRSSQESGRSAQVESKLKSYHPRLYRYNPFDLDLFADWLLAEPALSPQQIASGAEDPYIEYRILRRLSSRTSGTSRTLERMLPHLVLLERVDENLLRLLCNELGESDFNEVYRELSDQEWIDYRTLDEHQATLLEIDFNLLPRLRSYYGLERLRGVNGKSQLQNRSISQLRLDQVDEAKRQLGSLLKDMVLGREDGPPAPLNRLSSYYVDAALRLLPPTEASEVWEAVERRLPTELGWASTQRFLEVILAQEMEKERSEHPLLAGVRAAQASMLLHTNPRTSLSGIWQEVEESAARYPQSPEKDRLVLRSLFGRYAAADFHLGVGGLPQGHETLSFLSTVLSVLEKGLSTPAEILSGSHKIPSDDQQILASACAALANYLDTVEYSLSQGGNFIPAADPEQLLILDERLKESSIRPDLAAFARSLVGRLIHLVGDREKAWTIMRDAINQAPLDDAEWDRDVWLDWIPPHSLRAHLRLQALSALPAALDAAAEDDLLTWRIAALPDKGNWNVDCERLISATLSAELRYHPVALDSIMEIRQLWDGTTFESECLAHEQTPLLLLALTRSYLALGRCQEAIELLDDPAESARDPILVQAARQGYLECLRRLRIYLDTPWIKDWVESQDSTQAICAWPVEYLTGRRSLAELKQLLPENAGPAWLHLWNQLQRRKEDLDFGRVAQSIAVSGNVWQGPFGASYEEDALTVDGVQDLIRQGPTVPIFLDSGSWLQLHPGQVDSALRLSLLLTVVSEPSERVIKILRDETVYEVPIRRRAEIALEEGELRALRDPPTGQTLLELARSWFEEAGDTFGVLQASICTALVYARQRNMEQILSDYLEATVHPAYEAFRSNISDLPDWENLRKEGIDEHTSFGKLSDNYRFWTGWLSYLLVAQLSTQPGTQEQILALGNPSVRYLPPELDLHGTADMAGEGVGQKSFLQHLIESFFAFLLTLIILAVTLGGFYVLYRVFIKVFEPLGMSDQPTYVRVFFFLLFWGLSAWGLNRLRLRLQGFGELNLSVRSTKRDAGRSYALERQSLGFQFGSPFIAWKKISWSWQSNSLQEIRANRETSLVYTQALEHLKNLVSNPTVHSMPFEIESPEQRDHTQPWEQLWAELLESRNPLALFQKFAMHRVMDGLDKGTVWPQIGWKLGLVRLVCSASTAEAVSRGWKDNAPALALTDKLPVIPELELKSINAMSAQNLVAASSKAQTGLFDILAKLNLTLQDLNEKVSPQELDQMLMGAGWRSGRLRAFRAEASRAIVQRPDLQLPYRVLHMVGAPISTPTGLAWQIISATTTEMAYQQKTYETAETSEILTPGRIPVSLTSLVILQGEPSNAPLSSLVDELQASDLRVLACTLVAAGAPAVLLLPPLPFAWTAPVVQAVAQALRGNRPPDERRLLKATQAARLAIAQSKTLQPLTGEQMPETSRGVYGDPEQQIRLAMQVCLFLRSKKWGGKVLKRA